MIEVLCVTTKLHVGGVQTFLKNFAPVLIRKGVRYNFAVQTDEKQPYDDYFSDLGCRIFHISSMTDSKYRFIKDLYDLLKAHPEIKIIHSHLNFANVYSLAAAKLAGVKVRISHAHSSYEAKSFFDFLRKQFMHLVGWRIVATDYWACSDKAALWLYGNSGKSRVIKNAINLSEYKFDIKKRNEYRQKYQIENDFVWIHVGSFSKSKNHQFLLNLFSEFLKEHKNSKLILCGDGGERKTIEQQIDCLGIKNAVVLLGNVNNCQDYLCASDVFVFPSMFEGFSLSVIEAEATGLPCVVSKAVPDDAICCGNVNKIPMFCIKDWLDAIQKVYDEKPGERENGVERIKNSALDLDSEGEKLAELYISTLKRK